MTKRTLKHSLSDDSSARLAREAKRNPSINPSRPVPSQPNQLDDPTRSLNGSNLNRELRSPLAAVVARERSADEDSATVTELALLEIGAQLTVLDRYAANYTRRYVDSAMTGSAPPRRPVGMHPKIAAALRDIVLDEITGLRLFGTLPRGAA